MGQQKLPRPLPDPIPSWIGFIGRLAVGGILIAAGTLKAAAPPEEFALIIESYRLSFISPDMILTLATFLPWAELFTGWCLLAGYFTRQAASLALLLFLTFLTALISVKVRGIPLPNCGCFGGSFHPSVTHGLVLDSAMVCLCFLAYRTGREILSLDKWCSGGYN